jgi:hypothetical protein
MLPFVRKANAINTTNSRPNALSRMRRKVGYRDEPGVNMFAKKEGLCVTGG